MTKQETQSQQTKFLSVVMMVVALAGTVIFIAMILFLWWTHNYENRVAQTDEKEHLREVLTITQKRTLALLENLVPYINTLSNSPYSQNDAQREASAPQYGATLDRALRYVDGIYVVRLGILHEIARKAGMARAPTVEDGAGLEEILHTALAPYGLIFHGGVSSRSDGAKSLSPNDIPRQFLVRNGNDVLLATIYFVETTGALTPLENHTLLLSIIGVKKIDDFWLGQIMKASGVNNLRLSTEAGENAVPYDGLKGLQDDGLALTFEPDRPGERIVTRMSPILFTVGALFFVLMILQSLRVMSNLSIAAEVAHRTAEVDVLSGLPNRRHFIKLIEDYMAKCTRDASKLALFYVDVDRFKEINDCFGHEAGDQLIIRVSERLKSAVRAGDCVARLGGDEFAILAQDISCEEDVIALAKRVMEQFAFPFELEAGSPDVTPSIGIAVYPDDAKDRATLMRVADFALYRAKQDGRNQYRLFDPKLRHDLALRKTIERELREAIEIKQLGLVFQPLMSRDGKTMVAVEALCRWNHPVHGNIPPDIFIGIAEELGLITKLGKFILNAACEKAVNWPKLRLAINISAIELKSSSFVTMVGETLKRHNLEPERLELELTERVVIDDADRAEQMMLALRLMGVRLALDDFGTGYSSLIYLRRFPLDKIKIDKSFVNSLETQGESCAIVQSIIQMGNSLGLTVTAEGIETEDQHTLLKALGCDEMQGYFFSRPVTSMDIDALYAAQNPSDLVGLTRDNAPAQETADEGAGHKAEALTPDSAQIAFA